MSTSPWRLDSVTPARRASSSDPGGLTAEMTSSPPLGISSTVELNVRPTRAARACGILSAKLLPHFPIRASIVRGRPVSESNVSTVVDTASAGASQPRTSRPLAPVRSVTGRVHRGPLRGDSQRHENPCPSRRHRRRRHRLQRALPLGERGLDRLPAHRTQRADLRLDVARGRGHWRAGPERDHDLAAPVLVRALPEARSGDRPVLRIPPRGRRDARPHRAAHGGDRAVPLEGAPGGLLAAMARRRGSEGARADSRSLRREGRAVRREPRTRRPERRDPRVREGRARPRGGDRAPLPGARDEPARRRHVGGFSISPAYGGAPGG